MLNKAQVIGYVGKEPKISTTQNNAKIASFSIATTEKSYTTQNGVTIPERTEWHNIVVFGKLAEVIEKYVHKGSRMYVEGKMRTRAFTDKNGVQKTITEINVDNLEMLDSKPTQQSANADVSQTNIRQTSQSYEQSVMFASEEMRSGNDNLPF